MDAKMIFDNLKHMGVYIIDKETKVIYYENALIKQYLGRDTVGEPCFKVHGNTGLCSFCPLRQKDHTNYIKRTELNMSFIVRCEDIIWNDIPCYMVTIVKQEDKLKMTKEEQSLTRMSSALEKTVNIYTEINLDTMRYRQINIRNADGFNVNEEGEYETAYQYMIDNEIHPDDVEQVKKSMAPEVFKTIANDDNGVFETVARYRLKNVTPTRVMESRAIFMRDEIPHYVVSITRDVTKEIQVQNKAQNLEEILNNVSCGVAIYDVFDNNEMKVLYVNEGVCRLAECTKEQLFAESQKDPLFTVDKKYHTVLKDTVKKIIDGDKYASTTYQSKTYTGHSKWIEIFFTASKNEPENLRIYATFFDVTIEKEQQLQLLRNQKAVALAQNQGNLAIWTYNIDKGIIIQQTPTDVEGHMGYPIHIEKIPEYFVENNSVHPNDVNKFINEYKKLDQGVEKTDLIYRLINQKTGKYSWVHMYYQRMKNTSNDDRMAVGFCMDVNEQQEAIERYHIEQKLRKQLYDDAVIFLEYNLTTLKNEDTTNLPNEYKSQRWQSPDEKMYIENMSQNVEDEYLDQVIQTLYAGNLLKAFNEGKSRVICEYRSKERVNKPSTWYRTTVIMTHRPESEDIMAFVYVQNIEKEKEKQLALENSMRDGIESIAIIDVNNHNARQIRTAYNTPPKDIGENFVYNDQFVERSISRVIDEEKEFVKHAALLSTVIEELKKQDIYQYSISMNYPNGIVKRHLFRFRYLDDRKREVILSISDITSVYLEEQEKKKQLEIALSNAKEASLAKADFYSRMSHDMRTPMNGILGMTALSKDEYDVAILRENMDKINESGEYLLNLINDTLDVQRIESGKMKLEPKVVNTMDIVSNILDMVRVTAKNKGVNLKYSAGNTDLRWYINADDLRLKQIFINLLSNAIKFTPKDGTVELEFKLLSREGNISHDIIYVRDSGIGMSEEFLKNGIFKPFCQENNEYSSLYAGSGLGLSIVKRLVEMMNGKIEVESELGVGTTFAVYLDFERVDNELAIKQISNQQIKSKNIILSLQGKKVLLAEDHPLNAEITKKLLEKVGCIVEWAKNGQEVVEIFKTSNCYSFDAILMDIRMPIMDGLEATRRIRKLDKEDAKIIPIIAMTANAYEEDAKKSLEAGMNDHLGKPIRPQLMYEVLSKFVDVD